MKTAQHTPGPWRIDEEYNVFVGADDTIMIWVSAPQKFNGDDPEIIANARLITAAPDMLTALKECLPLFENVACGEVEERVRAAIAKAEGVA